MAEERRIPSLTIPALAILLTVAAFLAGSFWTKIQYLQGGTQEEVVASPAPEEIEEGETVLGAEEIAKIAVGGAVKGSEEAPVTIVEFSEYQCPFCKKYVDEAYQQIGEEYGDQIRYIFRDYPLPFHQHAQKMAEVARCAGDQEKYWEMHDLLFEKQDEWTEETEIGDLITTYASSLGLATEEFSDCLDSGKYTQAVQDDFELGQTVGVSGTPTFFINGRMLVGAYPFEAFKEIIDEELNQ